MPKFIIKSSVKLEYSHSDSTNDYLEGFVELTDEEVEQLIDYIRENDSACIDASDIEDLYPEIFEKLDDAYNGVSSLAFEFNYQWNGLLNQCYEYDVDRLMKHCEENCGFKFEYNEEDYLDSNDELDEESIEDEKFDYFNEWLPNYLESLSARDQLHLFFEYINDEVNFDYFYYEVEIPEGIIKLAQGEL